MFKLYSAVVSGINAKILSFARVEHETYPHYDKGQYFLLMFFYFVSVLFLPDTADVNIYLAMSACRLSVLLLR